MAVALGRFGLLVGCAILGLASGASAQTFPCAAETAGQLSVQGTVQCECRWHRESHLAGTPAAWRWHCGILQARMNQDAPATADPYRYPLPRVLLLKDLPSRHEGSPP